ncbi:hypothetical protein [Streptomyces sp. NPDC087294]|uniref:hypothetical protein n=1 Tax=Streptomyces sp. NPDC087294 TaxID=3365777 RepID=UPI0037F6A824
METRFDDWPVVTFAADGADPNAVREAILTLLRDALARREPFAAALDVRADAPATGADPKERTPGGKRDPRAAEHARAVRDLRTALAAHCRGLAFVGGRALDAEAMSRFWGCPVAHFPHQDQAETWARQRLT